MAARTGSSSTRDSVVADADTKERIMDAALHLFADRGFENVTLRQITQAAGVNVAAVNYHFGSKMRLLAAVFGRCAAPVNAERRQRFEALRAHAKTGPEMLSKILRAFIEPSFRAGKNQDHAYRRLMGRMSASPNPEIRRLLFHTHDEMARSFVELLRSVRPDLCNDEFFWRLTCVYGAMMYAQADNGRIRSLAGEDFDAGNIDMAMRFMIPFLTAGFAALPNATEPAA